MALDYKNSLTRYRRYLQVAQQQPWMRANLYVILSLALVIILLISALRPTLITIAGLLGQINQNQKIERALDEKIGVVQQAEEVLQRVEPQLEIIDEAVPSDVMWGKFAQEVGQLATGSGIRLESVVMNPIEGGDGGKLVMWNFTVSGDGGYANAKKFVDELEKMRRVVVVTTVDMLKTGEGEVTLSLAGKFGFLPNNL
ncbi:type 4a pilus biogenesis protein PilO [Candidatus Amesbacteria bacterium]|nr:type 4a pilus biogenesis protein PilO [Candidatus Amesbacteria bacterium]MBI2587376.1 type 4a pilus biogenesis protein PilO [Candidatus Amesbacteria bacterium]